MLRPLPAAIVAVALLWPATPRAAADAGWRRPVDGDLRAPFAYDRTMPFAAGARRGVDLVAPPGTRVRAACSGIVSFVGAVPRHGPGVTIRCGRLVATELGLRRTAVRRGAFVLAGARVGIARGPVLRLGARRVGDRLGYVDPLELLGDARTPQPHLPVPPRPSPAPRRPSLAPRRPLPAQRLPVALQRPDRVPVPAPRPGRAPVLEPAGERAGLPALGWVAVALLATGTCVGAIVRRGPRRVRLPRVAAPAVPAPVSSLDAGCPASTSRPRSST